MKFGTQVLLNTLNNIRLGGIKENLYFQNGGQIKYGRIEASMISLDLHI